MCTRSFALVVVLGMVFSPVVSAEKTAVNDHDVLKCLEAGRVKFDSKIIHIVGASQEGKFEKINGRWYRVGVASECFDDVPHMVCLRSKSPTTDI